MHGVSDLPVRMPSTRQHVDCTSVLNWWSSQIGTIPEWCKAARIVFAMSPNSASCERVFSLLKVMFGEARKASLSDMLQSALMLRYNKRHVG
jgi:hypothetical protein